MTSFRVDQLSSEVQRAVGQYGLNGVADAVLDAKNLPAIDAALARTDISDDAKRLVREVRNVAGNPLVTPRTDGVAQKVTKAIGAAKPWYDIDKLTPDEMKAMRPDERASAINHIVSKTGLGWYEGRVNNAKEAKILQILATTPDAHKGEVVHHLMAQGIHQRIAGSVDGAELEQYKAFMRDNIWLLTDPSDIAMAMRTFSVHDLANTTALIAKLREHKGEDMAERVTAQLLQSGYFQPLLPFVYWAPSFPRCDDLADVLNEAAWIGMQEVVIRQHKAQLEQFIQALPHPNGQEGNTIKAIRQEFDSRHNLQRIAQGFNFVTCAATAMAATQRRAQEEADRRVRAAEEAAEQRVRAAQDRGVPAATSVAPSGTTPTQRSGNGIDSAPRRRSGNGL